MKPVKKPLLLIIITTAIIFGVVYWLLPQKPKFEETTTKQNIDSLLEARKTELLTEGSSEDPFGQDDLVRILLIGLDTRLGETKPHCDAIQLIELDRAANKIAITAVPRGTYSELPPGQNYLASEYYVSNACAIDGLAYGIEKIEKIIGKKTDYIVVLGFSEALGILRRLELPAEETLQWLRLRQGYTIGEPQRARNHSTFIKQQLINLPPKINSAMNIPWQFILYKMVHTDLSFSQTREIIAAIGKMNLATQPENISLAMKPPHAVQDIPYDPTKVDEYLKSRIEPIKHLLPAADYSAATKEAMEEKILAAFNENKQDQTFITWAFDNGLWFQIEDAQKRETLHYEIISKYVSFISDEVQREKIIADYIMKMDEINENAWATKGRDLLVQTLNSITE